MVQDNQRAGVQTEGDRRGNQSLFTPRINGGGQEREEQVRRVPFQVTPGSRPSCYFALLSKPNSILPICHTSAAR